MVPQSILGGLSDEVTVPLPVPVLLTVSVKVVGVWAVLFMSIETVVE